MFRLPDARAVINRYGFNSDGMPTVAQRLLVRCGGGQSGMRLAAPRALFLRVFVLRFVLGGVFCLQLCPGKARRSEAHKLSSLPSRSHNATQRTTQQDRKRNLLASGAAAANPNDNGGEGRLLGVNLGKNKTTEDAAADYEVRCGLCIRG